jgi:hypothetical protein
MRLIGYQRCLLLACVGPIALVAACDRPNVDAFRRDGGAAPDPTGVMEGTVLYVGPRPQCERDADGHPTAVIGMVVLTLFDFYNPPPPAGSATSAISLLTIPGSSMFSLEDCMPIMPTSEERRPIMRSTAFTWPEIPLGSLPCETDASGNRVCPGRSYQVSGFYDYDGDFNPFFGVRNLPTAGDVGGGAFVSTAVSPPQPLQIRFGHIADHPNGQVVTGVAVTLGAVVVTERPIFEVDPSTRALDSATTLPGGTDPVAREQTLWEASRMRLTAIVNPSMPTPSMPWLRALEAAGIDPSNYRFGVPEYGFYITQVDANADMMPDGHPILGTAGILWYTPIVIVRRARSPIEQRLGLPDVVIVGTIRPTVPLGLMSGGIPKRTMMAFDVVIPPVAVMVTNPAFPSVCRAPIIPPGNPKETYERIWVDCQELPSGNYDVNVLSGIAGGKAVNERERCIAQCLESGGSMMACETSCNFTVPAATDSGWVIDGGNFSSQAWSIPNELGCVDRFYRINAVNQIDPRRPDGSLPECGDDLDGDGMPAGRDPDDSAMMESQGRLGGWAIVDVADPDPASGFDPASLDDGHGVRACQMAASGSTGEVARVTYMPPPLPECCPPHLDQFCGLPLCPRRAADTEVAGEPVVGLQGPYPYPEAVRPGLGGQRFTREIRVPGEDYIVHEDGRIEPRCTPFLMPVECCRIAAMRAGR